MKVVFLDIDGVLVPINANGHNFEEQPVLALRELIDWGGVRIVISSSWRGFDHLYHELRRTGLFKHVIGDTPDLRAESTRAGILIGRIRGDEIQQWLDEHKSYVEGFVILDDETDMGTLRPWLVQTNAYTGFNASSDVARAKRILLRDPFPKRMTA